MLRACSANIDELRKSLAQFIKENTPTVGGAEEVDTQPTLGFQRVIQRAICMCSPPGSGKKKSLALTCWWRFSARRIRMLCTTCTSKA